MEKKVYAVGNKGMLRDTSISKRDNEHSYENINIRITATDKETLLSISNERGHKVASTTEIKGQILGHCSVADKEVIFTKEQDLGYIYTVSYNEAEDTFEVVEFYSSSNLNFNEVEEIDCIGISERTDLHKVYWVDGVNQNRMLILEKDYSSYKEKGSSPFDFVQNFTYDFKEGTKAYVNNTFKGIGLMPAGTVQYFLTYYNDMGQETNIVWASDLQYSTFENRGASPEETTNSSFEIQILDPDFNFDYARVYGYIITSENATGVAYIAGEVDLRKIEKEEETSFTILDNGSNHEDVDPSVLLYLGGTPFVSKTLCSKAGKLFLGNIKYAEAEDSEEVREIIEDFKKENPLEFVQYSAYYDSEDLTSYEIQTGVGSSNLKTFKYGETYRFGIQLIKDNGSLSRAYFLGDLEDTIIPEINRITKINLAAPSSSIIQRLNNLGYTKYRLMFVEPTYSDRKVVAQGILSPTVFNAYDRDNNQNTYAYPSWFLENSSIANFTPIDAQIQNRDGKVEPISKDSTDPTDTSKLRDEFFYDTSIVTLNSPEFDYEKITNVKNNYTLHIVGKIYPETYNTSILIDVSKRYNNDDSAEYPDESPIVVGYPMYYIKDKHYYNKDSYISDALYYIYPFHRYAIEDPSNDDNKNQYFIINKKIFANNRYCKTSYLQDGDIEVLHYTINSTSIGLYNNVDKQPLSINYNDKAILYAGDISIISTLSDNDATYPLYYTPKRVEAGKPYVYQGEVEIEDKYACLVYSPKELIVGNTYFKIKDNLVVVSNDKDLYFVSISGDYKIKIVDKLPKAGSSKDPISITYRASTHAVMALGSNNRGAYTLPLGSITDDQEVINFHTTVNKYSFVNDYTTFLDNEDGYLLAELRQNVVPYGGNSELAIEKNVFTPISEITPLHRNVESNDGDTYFTNYEFVKTMPRNDTDVNQILDITSCMLETHINLDGRYDTKRHTKDLLTINWNNFAPVNMAYSTNSSLFTSTTFDERFSNGNYDNTIVHSLIKQNNSKIDTWTSVTMASSVDTDSNYGALSVLRVNNGKVVAFQDRAISYIPFNEQAVVNTQDGVPLEIANNNSVGNPQIVTDKYGCKQMKSIVEAKSGLYFYDDYNQIIASIGEGITPLSTQKGFDIFLREKKRKYQSFYDNRRGDIYFVYDDAIKPTLCYSEYLGEFTSFYTFNPDIMFLNKGSWMSIYQHTLLRNNVGDYHTWLSEEDIEKSETLMESYLDGQYNITSSLWYRITPDPYGDKIFTNLNYRLDYFEDDKYIPEETFSTIQAFNEYQDSGIRPIYTGFKGDGVRAYKKFRIWNADIPRDSKDPKKPLDRIRNPWFDLKLTSNTKHRFELHNMNVIYYE